MPRTSLFFVSAALAIALRPGSLAAQGMPLGPEFRVNTFTTGGQMDPSIAAYGAGDFVVVWESYNQDGGGLGIFGQRYASSGAPAGLEFRVNTVAFLDQQDPAVASDDAGSFVVAWNSNNQDGFERGVFAQRYASSGAPAGPEFRVNSYTTGYQGRPAVARVGSGDFVIVWQSNGQDGSVQGVFGQRYAATGAPAGPEFRVNTYAYGNQVAPAVAVDGSGNFVVAWSSSIGQDGSADGIFAQRYASSGSPLGPEFLVNTYTLGRQVEPAVDADASGNFVILWRSDGQDGSSGGVFGQRYAASGAPLGGEFRLNAYTTNAQGRPSITSDVAGNFVAVWQSDTQDGFDYGIFGQRYAAAGTPLGPEFRVNSFVGYRQLEPAVASDALDRFVVVWTSRFQKGPSLNEWGVFGQRYSEIFPVELMRFTVE